MLEAKHYGPTRLIVDGGTFKDCTFDGSTLVYFGGKIPHMENCAMNGVRFEFGGPAKNTVELLAWLRQQKMID